MNLIILLLTIYIINYKAFKNLIESSRIDTNNTDVRPYVVDDHVTLCELTNGIGGYYYWQPAYGDDASEAYVAN